MVLAYSELYSSLRLSNNGKTVNGKTYLTRILISQTVRPLLQII